MSRKGENRDSESDDTVELSLGVENRPLVNPEHFQHDDRETPLKTVITADVDGETPLKTLIKTVDNRETPLKIAIKAGDDRETPLKTRTGENQDSESDDTFELSLGVENRPLVIPRHIQHDDRETPLKTVIKADDDHETPLKTTIKADDDRETPLKTVLDEFETDEGQGIEHESSQHSSYYMEDEQEAPDATLTETKYGSDTHLSSFPSSYEDHSPLPSSNIKDSKIRINNSASLLTCITATNKKLFWFYMVIECVIDCVCPFVLDTLYTVHLCVWLACMGCDLINAFRSSRRRLSEITWGLGKDMIIALGVYFCSLLPIVRVPIMYFISKVGPHKFFGLDVPVDINICKPHMGTW